MLVLVLVLAPLVRVRVLVPVEVLVVVVVLARTSPSTRTRRSTRSCCFSCTPGRSTNKTRTLQLLALNLAQTFTSRWMRSTRRSSRSRRVSGSSQQEEEEEGGAGVVGEGVEPAGAIAEAVGLAVIGYLYLPVSAYLQDACDPKNADIKTNNLNPVFPQVTSSSPWTSLLTMTGEEHCWTSQRTWCTTQPGRSSKPSSQGTWAWGHGASCGSYAICQKSTFLSYSLLLVDLDLAD